MPPEKRAREGRADRGERSKDRGERSKDRRERSKEKTRHRRSKRNTIDEIPNKIIPNVAKTKTKSKSRKKLRKKTLTQIIEKPPGFPLESGTFEEEKNLFTVRKRGPGLTKEVKRSNRERRGTKLQALDYDRKPTAEGEMAAGSSKGSEKAKKAGSEKKRRKKPGSLPPLPRAPKSPISASPVASMTPVDTQTYRTFIGSPPPSGFRKKQEPCSIQTFQKAEDEESGEDAFLDEEVTAYSPTPSLEQSYPKITIKRAPGMLYEEEDVEETPPQQENAIVSASSRRSDQVSISSLIRSTSSLNLNSSLSLPPKLLSYVAEDGSPAVQEWVPEDRVLSASITRRCSTPSIRDLPSPLRGVSPLEIVPRRPPEAKKLSKPKLSPLAK